jgi:uncharacterized protein (DUF433 family)
MLGDELDLVERSDHVGFCGVSLMHLIGSTPGVRSGKPRFVGTRITVVDVLEYLASGMTAEQITADFPELTDEHIKAALEFAAVRERRLASAWDC